MALTQYTRLSFRPTPQVLNTLMHIHLTTGVCHGDVAEHNIVYSVVNTVDGTLKHLATLVDFGSASFKDVSLLGAEVEERSSSRGQYLYGVVDQSDVVSCADKSRHVQKLCRSTRWWCGIRPPCSR